MSLVWTGLPQRDEQPYTIPPRRHGDRLPVLKPKGMTTFAVQKKGAQRPSATARNQED